METEMSPVVAVRAIFDNDSSKPVSASELMQFWKACTPEEKAEFAESAARQLGVTLKAV